MYFKSVFLTHNDRRRIERAKPFFDVFVVGERIEFFCVRIRLRIAVVNTVDILCEKKYFRLNFACFKRRARVGGEERTARSSAEYDDFTVA